MKDTISNTATLPKTTLYDVIISGAGPVGLFLACELGLAGVSVLVLEKADEPYSALKKFPFGIRGLSAPTIEALYYRGLFEGLELHKRLKNPHAASGEGALPPRQAGHFAGISFYEANIDRTQWHHRLPSATPTSLLTEIAELETLLAHRATALGVTIRRGMPVTGFEATEDGVTVQCGATVFNGKWLVGCDGSRSIVRKQGNFEFAGTEPEFTGYSLSVDIADPEKLRPGRNLTARGMYLQSQPGYFGLLDFDGGASHSPAPLTREQVQEVLRRISDTDVTLTALHTATTWTDRARQATTYRNGRVLLAGDAAHIHSPLGGQGLNLGLGDAMNLGWKLAATIRNKAPEGLLDTYTAERHPIGAAVLDWSRAQVAIMKPDPAARALNAVMQDLMGTRDGTTYIAGRIWGIFTQYDLGDSHPLVGYTMPNFEFEDGVKTGRLLHDGHGLLLDFEGAASLQAWAGKYEGQIRYISGKPKERLGFSALLIRPDGSIAWGTTRTPDLDALQKAADLWWSITS